MDNQNNVWAWVIGLIVVVLVIAGIWWYSTGGTAGNMASTTPETATSTDTTGPAPVSSETRSGSTVAQVVASLSDASSFNSLFVSSGVAASLSGKGPYTVFVPSNAAFKGLPAGTISNMTAAQQKRLAQYAVVVGKMLDIDAVSSGHYTALSKDPINFQVNLQSSTVTVNSGLAFKQYKASNGIVYEMSAVLVPPQTPNANGSTGTPHP